MNLRKSAQYLLLSPASDGGGNASLPENLRPKPVRQPHRVLGLSHDELDPVTIIAAAQVRLRGLRRVEMERTTVPLRARILEVIAARESLLLLAAGRPSVRRHGVGDGKREGDC